MAPFNLMQRFSIDFSGTRTSPQECTFRLANIFFNVPPAQPIKYSCHYRIQKSPFSNLSRSDEHRFIELPSTPVVSYLLVRA